MYKGTCQKDGRIIIFRKNGVLLLFRSIFIGNSSYLSMPKIHLPIQNNMLQVKLYSHHQNPFDEKTVYLQFFLYPIMLGSNWWFKFEKSSDSSWAWTRETTQFSKVNCSCSDLYLIESLKKLYKYLNPVLPVPSLYLFHPKLKVPPCRIAYVDKVNIQIIIYLLWSDTKNFFSFEYGCVDIMIKW